MREIQSSEAKTHLPQLPEHDRRTEEIDRAIAEMNALRRRGGTVPLAELPPARHEGHKY